MKIWRLLAIIVSLLFTASVYAQGKPFACQYDASGGLKWENGKWRPALFESGENFILVLENKTLTLNSVSKPLEMPSVINIACTSATATNHYIRCMDIVGGYLIYNTSTMKGTVAQTIGGTVNSNKRDTLTVSPFTCQPF